MASIKIVLNEEKLNIKTGKAPIYLRLIKDRKTKFISLGIKVEPKYWNANEMRVKKGARNYQEYNSYIAKKRSEAESTALKFETGFNGMTAKKIKEEIMGKTPENFFEFSKSRLKKMKHSLSPSSYKMYHSHIDKLKTYIGNSDLSFNDIDVKFVKEYESYMYNELGNSGGTVVGSFGIIKVFFNQAINEGLVDANIYPFRRYKFKIPKSKRTYLNNEQFENLNNYLTKSVNKTSIFSDMYMLSCYAGGLRFFDIVELRWVNYNELEQRLIKVIRKTGRKHQFKLPNRAVEILQKYKKVDSNQMDYVFPLLRNDFNYDENIEQLYFEKSKYNKQCNVVLNKIGKELEFPFKLTFHSSRHTFATRALNKGMRIEHVSKILDHGDISITQIYAKIVNEELDKAMAIMDE